MYTQAHAYIYFEPDVCLQSILMLESKMWLILVELCISCKGNFSIVINFLLDITCFKKWKSHLCIKTEKFHVVLQEIYYSEKEHSFITGSSLQLWQWHYLTSQHEMCLRFITLRSSISVWQRVWKSLCHRRVKEFQGNERF